MELELPLLSSTSSKYTGVDPVDKNDVVDSNPEMDPDAADWRLIEFSGST